MSDQQNPAAVPESFTAAEIDEIRRVADQRVVMAELKARALLAGMVDLDGLKLLDTSGVILNDGGDVQVPDGFFEAARQAKPYLFGRSTAGGSTAKAPAVTAPVARSAVEMSTEEWQAARAALLRLR